MSQQHSKQTVSPSSVLQYPSHWQKTLRGLVYTILSGTVAARILNRAAWITRRVSYITFDLKEHLASYYKTLFHKAKFDDSIMAELVHWTDNESCDILITMPVRKLGNYHCYFEEYLEDLTRLTKNTQSVVTYVTIDQDDDLVYFLELQKKFAPNLRVRYFINPQRGGYVGGHALHSMMIDESSNNYKIWMLGASDMQPAFHGWDEALYEAAKPLEHMCIIGGGPAHFAGAIHGPNPDGCPPIYWVGTDDFVFASKPTIDTLISHTRDTKHWFCLGDTWHIDGFFADLVRHMMAKGYPNYFVATEPLFIERDPGGWQGVPNRERTRNETLQEFFQLERQRMHAKFADQLIKANTGQLKN